MVRNRYRLILDVDVTLHDFTPERCAAVYMNRRESWIKNGFTHILESMPEGPHPGSYECTRDLVAEIRKDPAMLDAWMRKSVLLHAMCTLETASNATPRDEEVIHAAIERLGPRARHWWRQTFAAEDDETFERVEYLFDTLETTVGLPIVTVVLNHHEE